MSVNNRQSHSRPEFSRDKISKLKRVVVKVGSALLTDTQRGLSVDLIDAYCRQIHELKNAGYEIVLVSSGAVAEGCARLGWQTRPDTVHELQAAAAVGQMGLAQAYESALGAFARHTAMVMLTHDDLANRQRYLNARSTLEQLLMMQVVPVINENDTVATEEIRFGDNDTLAALVTNLIQADLLIILTDVDGLMDADPRLNKAAKRISQASAQDSSLDQMPSANSGKMGRGGMVTKLSAARLAAQAGAHTIIANGRQEQVLMRCLSGEDMGTLLTAELSPMTARKRWIAGNLRAHGALCVDAGAKQALVDQGVSLLAVGLSAVEGTFERGDLVLCKDAEGRTFAQGLVNYNSTDARALIGVRSENFSKHLDLVAEPELIHRDNLVLI